MKMLIGIFALALLLFGCTGQPNNPAPNITPAPGSAVSSQGFWDVNVFAFPYLGENKTYNSSSPCQSVILYGTENLIAYNNTGNTNATILVYDESGNIIDNESLANGSSSSNRTIAYPVYGKTTVCMTDGNYSNVKIVTKVD